MRIYLVCLLSFAAAHRLPAPIVEESPTPREHAAKSKPKRTVQKTNPSESSANARPRVVPVPVNAKKFAGTWSGLVDNNSWAWGGQHEMRFIIDAAESRVNVDPQAGSGEAKVNGNSISWKSTWYWNPWHWTLVVNPDGRTARVTATFADGGSASGIVTKIN